MTNFVEGTDYCLVFPTDDKSLVKIKLLSGTYAGVVYMYGKVAVEEKDGQGYLQFNYDVLESPIEGVEKDTNFKDTIGMLLAQFISQNMEDPNNEIGNIDSKEPVTE